MRNPRGVKKKKKKKAVEMGKSHNKGPIGVPGGGLTRDRKSMLSRWNISVGAL